MIGVIVIVLLAMLNGIFAMSEAAVIAANRVRLRQQADNGSVSARRALELAENPNRFLATVQIGITLIGILTGAFGSAALSDDLASILETIPALEQSSQAIAVGLIVILTTYLSLIVGELVPKRIALLYSERIAMSVARPMNIMATVTSPVVALLGASSSLILRLLRLRETEDESATDADIESMMQQGAQAGDFAEEEPEMVAGVLKMDTTPVVAIMIPRTDIVWLDSKAEQDDLVATIINSKRSRFPVGHGSLDDLDGYVEMGDLLRQTLKNQALDLTTAVREPLYIPEVTPVLNALEMFKGSHIEMAMIIGEYGGITGMITLNDILEEIVGDIDQEDPQAIQRADGSWLFDGLYPIDDFAALFELGKLDGDFPFQTVSGFVLTKLGRLPKASDQFQWKHLTVEVVDMDGKRVDKVLVMTETQD